MLLSWRRCLRALCLVCLPLLAQAESLLLVGPPWPPYLDPERNNRGFASEIVIEALAAAGHNDIKIRLQPWRRVLWDAQHGAADGLIGIWHSPEREDLVRFSKPYFNSPIVGISHAESTHRLRGSADLEGLRVAYREGARFGLGLDRRGDFIPVPVSTTVNVLRMVAQGRVDAGLEDGLIIRAYLEQHPELDEALRVSPQPLAFQPLHFGVIRNREGSESLLADFNRGLEMIRDNGTYAGIIRRHRLSRYLLGPEDGH